MKKCSKCSVTKEFSEYSKCSKSRLGVQSQCKRCKVSSVVNSPSSSVEAKRAYEKTSKRRLYKRNYHHKTKIARNISRRMRQSLKGERKSESWVDLVEYNLEMLERHLESLFSEGMTWENYGSVWHIDHIKPVSSFNILSNSCEAFKQCWSLDNLQPLFATDNLKKGSKY